MDNALALNYTGAWRDPVVDGLPLGNGYRTYLPDLMRFTTPDDLSPFGEGGVNPYAYCSGDPINFSDPSGQFQLSWTGGLGIVAALFGLGLAVVTGGSSLAVLGAFFGIASAATGIAADNTGGKTHDALMSVSILTGVIGGIIDVADIAKSTASALQLAGGIGRSDVRTEAAASEAVVRYTDTPVLEVDLTPNQLRTRGKRVGKGKYGKVYRLSDYAYKLSRDKKGVGYWNIFDDPRRVTQIWNDTFSNIYNGRLAYLATATPVRLNDGSVVMRTPFLRSISKPPTPEQIEVATEEFTRVTGRELLDDDVPGNVINISHNDEILSVVVDYGYTPTTEGPPSPGTEVLRGLQDQFAGVPYS